MQEKICGKCKIPKPLSAYGFHNSGKHKGELRTYCRECENLISKVYYQANKDIVNTKTTTKRYANGQKPMSENKECPSYLGIAIAEKALSNFFDHIIRMPLNNPNYDFICGKGFKIDVKASCLHYPKTGISKEGYTKTYHPYWNYLIKKNPIAEFYLLLAFNSREDLEPLHVWLIPAHILNIKEGITITNTSKALSKWSIYEKPLTNVIKCCNEMQDTEQIIHL
jgi:hypothetical protein